MLFGGSAMMASNGSGMIGSNGRGKISGLIIRRIGSRFVRVKTKTIIIRDKKTRNFSRCHRGLNMKLGFRSGGVKRQREWCCVSVLCACSECCCVMVSDSVYRF